LQGEFEKAVVQAHGFQWAPDFPNASTWPAQKWGWASSTIGTWAELSVDTRGRRGSGSSGGDAQALQAAPPPLPAVVEASTTSVYIGVLQSYKGMGVATVKCVANCTCQVRVLERAHERCLLRVAAGCILLDNG
jgi:hypothetical protein